ncbi:hypothetical protein ACIQMV_18860 [Streptomyces sp. NPDC091412]|uniref:hypothetical protein n=1 Tax=Streptomyces sp. NPDC091412 TaxID=3366002 RepID=UPI00381CCC45
MTDHFPRLSARASSPERVTELLALCREDYINAAPNRQQQHHHVSAFLAVAPEPAPATEPSDLDVAINVAQQLLDSDSALSLRESLRLLLRALGSEPTARPADTTPPALQCPAALPDDTSPCGGPVVVTVLALTNAGVAGCEHHAARLMVVAPGTYPVDLPHAPEGTATRVFRAAGEAGRR